MPIILTSQNWLTGGPLIIFTRYAKFDETKIRKLETVCNPIVGIDASQLYPFQWLWTCKQDCIRNERSMRTLQKFTKVFWTAGSRILAKHPSAMFNTLAVHSPQTEKIGDFFVDVFSLQQSLKQWGTNFAFVPVRKRNHCHLKTRKRIKDTGTRQRLKRVSAG